MSVVMKLPAWTEILSCGLLWDPGPTHCSFRTSTIQHQVPPPRCPSRLRFKPTCCSSSNLPQVSDRMKLRPSSLSWSDPGWMSGVSYCSFKGPAVLKDLRCYSALTHLISMTEENTSAGQQVLQKPVDPFILNQEHWSRETSKTCITAGSRGPGVGDVSIMWFWSWFCTLIWFLF